MGAIGSLYIFPLPTHREFLFVGFKRRAPHLAESDPVANLKGAARIAYEQQAPTRATCNLGQFSADKSTSRSRSFRRAPVAMELNRASADNHKPHPGVQERPDDLQLIRIEPWTVGSALHFARGQLLS
jgi:hypothetical protein